MFVDPEYNDLYRDNQETNSDKEIIRIKKFKGIESKEEFKGTWEYIVKYFAFCYNSICQIYKEAKYSISY